MRQAGAEPGKGRIGTGPPFWQVNHANSAYFGAISVNFPPISTLGPLFLQILDPALRQVHEPEGWVHGQASKLKRKCIILSKFSSTK